MTNNPLISVVTASYNYAFESFGEEIKRFYKGDFITDCVFFGKELKKAKQSMISIKFGKNYHLRILGLNILGSKK